MMSMTLQELQLHASKLGCLVVSDPSTNRCVVTVPLQSTEGYHYVSTNDATGYEHCRRYLAGIAMARNISVPGLLTPKEEEQWRARQSAERKLSEDRMKRGLIA